VLLNSFCESGFNTYYQLRSKVLGEDYK